MEVKAYRLQTLVLKHKDLCDRRRARNGHGTLDLGTNWARIHGVNPSVELRWGQPYLDEGAEAFEKRHQQVRIQRLTAMAKDLGYQLAPQIAQA